MRLMDGLATLNGRGPGRRGSWRWFPWAIVASLGLVIAVNGVMVWFALDTFPGQAGRDGFDLSNHYDRVLQRMQREAALGWDLRVARDTGGRLAVVLVDRAGVPLQDAVIRATAERPIGPPETTFLAFHDDGAGHYLADVVLSEPGQWELQLSVSARGHAMATTKRIVIGEPLRLKREMPAQSAG